jgi:hypothetical protein
MADWFYEVFRYQWVGIIALLTAGIPIVWQFTDFHKIKFWKQIKKTSDDSIDKERLELLEKEEFIRSYLRNYLTVGGVILFIISFSIGFFVDRTASQNASNQALLSTQGEIIKFIREVTEAKKEFDNAVKSVSTSVVEIRNTEDKVKFFAGHVSDLENKFQSTVAFQASDLQIKKIADALAKDPRITNVVNELGESITIHLNKTDEEINKIKSAYKIDFQDGKMTSTYKYNEKFMFSFPVKHAWIELASCMDQPILLEVQEIKDRVVSVGVKLTRDRTTKDYNKEIREMARSSPKVPFRIWATSF